MVFGIIRTTSSEVKIVIEIAKNLEVSKGIPIYTRNIWGLGMRQRDNKQLHTEIAIAKMTQHEVDCMKALGYDMRLTTLSRRDRVKRFKKLKHGKTRKVRKADNGNSK